MEILKHRLEEESRARATADSRILEVSLARKHRRIFGCLGKYLLDVCVNAEATWPSGWDAGIEIQRSRAV